MDKQVKTQEISAVLTIPDNTLDHQVVECFDCNIPTPLPNTFTVYHPETGRHEYVCEVCRGLTMEEHEELFAY